MVTINSLLIARFNPVRLMDVRNEVRRFVRDGVTFDVSVDESLLGDKDWTDAVHICRKCSDRDIDQLVERVLQVLER